MWFRFFNFCDKILKAKLNHVIVCRHFKTLEADICFIMTAYL